MDRLERIRAAKAAMDAEARRNEAAKAKVIKHFNDAFKKLGACLNELMVVGGAFYTCGMAYGKKFESNGITHELGFIFEYYRGKRVKLIGIGIKGGGCCGNDLVIDRNGQIIRNPLNHVIGGWTEEDAFRDFSYKCRTFFNGFDAFEKKFYDYVDNL